MLGDFMNWTQDTLYGQQSPQGERQGGAFGFMRPMNQQISRMMAPIEQGMAGVNNRIAGFASPITSPLGSITSGIQDMLYGTSPSQQQQAMPYFPGAGMGMMRQAPGYQQPIPQQPAAQSMFGMPTAFNPYSMQQPQNWMR